MELTETQYKQTEVGLIPEDWKLYSLGDIVKITSGESPSKFRFYDFGVPYYKVEQLNNSKKYTDETPYHIDDSLGKYVIKNSIVFPKRGASIMQNKIRIFKANSYLDTNLMALTLLEKYNHELIFYILTYQGLNKIADTTSIPQINNKHIIPYIIALPPTLEEQKAIATVLSDADALIANLEKLITKKNAIKQGAMQQLLTPPHKGGRRLAGFTGEWEEKSLGEIGDCIIGLTYKPENVVSEGTLVLRSSNIQDNKLSFSDNVYVNSSIPQNIRVQLGDILVCVRNGSRQLIGKCAYLDERVVEQTFGAFMSVYRTRYSKFIHQVFQSNDIKRQIDENLGATINQITNKMLNSFTVPFPPIEEQEAISKILVDMDKEINDLQSKKSKYEAIKQGMMQELLTGKTRLV